VFHCARRIVASPGRPTPQPPQIGEDAAMTAFRGVAAVLVLVPVLAGCGGGGGGGGGDDALSKAELVKRANAICARYAKQGDALKAPSDITDPAQARRFFDRAHDIAEHQQRELEGLRPGGSAKAQYQALTKATGDATTLLEDLAVAAKARDAQKGASLLRRLQPDSDAVDKAANAIGATRCAS
jgi:hypothetical protein